MVIKKIAVNTGGGDAPGLNAVIKGVTMAAIRRGWEVLGIKYGYRGLLDIEQTMPLTAEVVRHITPLGGTILGTTNKGNPFEWPKQTADGIVPVDRSHEIMDNFRKLKLDALVAIGGDGSLRLANKFHKERGMPVVGVPKTIDNDLSETVITFGFDSAVSTATEGIDKMHTTAEAHERIMVVEVMGRYAGWIALNSGVSASADVILIPEIPFKLEKVTEKIEELQQEGQVYGIVVVAEGAAPAGGEMAVAEKATVGREKRLGGIGQWIAKELQKMTGKESRCLVLGHLQRGGGPTTFDRLVSLRFGAAAVKCLAEGKVGVMVALDPPTVKAVPIEKAVEKMKAVPLDCDTVMTARALGISFGD